MGINYDFAHVELRNVAFRQPAKIGQILTSASRPGLLASVWDRMSAGEGATASPGHKIVLKTRPTARGDTLVVVSLPDALEITDVIYAGVLFSKPARRRFLFKKPPKLGYFTLEFSRDDDGKPSNFLCEWIASDGGFGHQDYGVAVDPVTMDGFAAALEATLLLEYPE